MEPLISRTKQMLLGILLAGYPAVYPTSRIASFEDAFTFPAHLRYRFNGFDFLGYQFGQEKITASKVSGDNNGFSFTNNFNVVHVT